MFCHSFLTLPFFTPPPHSFARPKKAVAGSKFVVFYDAAGSYAWLPPKSYKAFSLESDLQFKSKTKAFKSALSAAKKDFKPPLSSLLMNDGTQLHLGDKVKAYWRGGGQLYPGTEQRFTPSRKTLAAVPCLHPCSFSCSMLTCLLTHVLITASLSGTISSIHQDGRSVAIRYDDGDVEASVRIEKVRRQVGNSQDTKKDTADDENTRGGGGGGGDSDGDGEESQTVGVKAEPKNDVGVANAGAGAGAAKINPKGLSEYELQRLKQIQENQAMLASLGLGGGNASRYEYNITEYSVCSTN